MLPCAPSKTRGQLKPRRRKPRPHLSLIAESKSRKRKERMEEKGLCLFTPLFEVPWDPCEI
jgi:hypothetical protein